MQSLDLKKMHRISVVWGMIMLLLLLALTIIAIMYKKETKEYKEFETKIENNVKNYIEENSLYPETEINYSLSELVDMSILDTITIKDNLCEGYIEIRNEKQSFQYEAYIKCGDYKTRGYSFD